ncbi:OLC1v1012289C1 [Oldenlandia corymbosa var. corymbosa]|uniref:OLC1v1012289C1 n=1 Tax=Oldenlandia corymbosa var. corymbosa TaxID=529605 RepID=A0AAV1DVR2_OLDCO|nr:OLC1v1012289C1 [Oldenlandia corymbosa var. corymbosa]
MSCPSDEILELLDCLVRNFQDLANLKNDIIVSSKNQIMGIRRKLSVLRTLVDFSAKRCTDHQMLDYFLNYVKDLVDSAASLSVLCLLKGKDGTMAAQGLETFFSEQLEKCLPTNPEVTEMFIGVLKASKSSRSHKFQVGEDVVYLVDIILKDLVDPSKGYIQILKERLIFMITLSIYSVEEAVIDVGDEFSSQIDSDINEELSLIFYRYLDGIEMGLSSLQEKIYKVKKEIRKLYAPSLSSLSLNFPKTNGLAFINFLLENLEEMVKHNPSRIVFAKHQVMMVHDGPQNYLRAAGRERRPRSLEHNFVFLNNPVPTLQTTWIVLI